MIFTRDFKADLLVLLDAIQRREVFGFARFNTGEAGILQNKPTHARGSGWKFDPARNADYHEALSAAFHCTAQNFYPAISCPCCNPPEFQWYEKNLSRPWCNVTFATLLMGSNWPAARKWLLDHRSEYILVSPVLGDIIVPKNTFEPESTPWLPFFEQLIGAVKPVMFAAGPLGKILCHQLLPFAKGPLVDIGSTLDVEMFGKSTRIFMVKPLRQRLKDKKARKQNVRARRLWMRTCKWKMADSPVHKVKPREAR